MATETLIINPFCGLGKIVSGPRFVGRNDILATIKQRVLGVEFSNISIVGLPKIGKSSLVWECLMQNRRELIPQKTIIVYYQMGSTRTSFDFFKKLLAKTDDEFCDMYEDEKYSKYAQTIVDSAKNTDSFDELTDNLEHYYKKLRKWGYKVIVILDEFDHAQDIFELADFQELREISYEPESKICIVTCSRKTLSEIESNAKDGKLSNFARIFSDCPLKVFNEADVVQYWERVSSSFKADNEHKTLVEYLVGNHPWLMDVVNDYYFTHINDNLTSVDMLNGIKLSLMQGLDEMMSTLEKENLLNAAIQLVIGPYDDVTQLQVEKLLSYGFIRSVALDEKDKLFSGNRIGPEFGDRGYVCFSSFSTLDLYRRYYADVPYDKLWSETENSLRFLIKMYITERYVNWESDMSQYLSRNLPHRGFDMNRWEDNVQRLKNNMNDMIATFPTMRGNHIVDFTLTSQIFDIFIKCDWSWFGNVFLGERADWFRKFEHITKVRNPVAHNNPGDIRAEKDLAKTYCIEIQNSIADWRSKHQ